MIAPILVGLLAAAAQAQTRRAKPQTVERAAFEQSFELIRVHAARSYVANEDMPDTSLLEPLLANLGPAQAAAARKRLRALNDLLEEARYVQKGRHAEDDAQTYQEMVALISDNLGAGPYADFPVAKNKARRAQIDACLGAGPLPNGDRNAAIVKCKGRLKAESLYLDPKRPVLETALRTSPEESSVRALLLSAVADSHSRVGDQVPERVTQRLNETRQALLRQIQSGPAEIGETVAAGAAGATRSSRKVDTTLRVPAPKPSPSDRAVASILRPPARDTDLTIKPPPLQNVDFKKGADLAQVALDNHVGFKERCYAYVKKALSSAGIMDADEGGGSAYMFNRFFKEKHLESRKLRRLKGAHWPLPIGSIVVWSPGACDYSAKHGHIEILVSINPPRACSDGCGGFQVSCLESYTSQSEKAGAEYQTLAPKLDGLTGSRKTQLARHLKALADKRDNPRVNVYVLERPSAVKPVPAH